MISVWIGNKSLSFSLGSLYSPKPKPMTIIVDIIDGADNFAYSGSSTGAE